MRRASWKSFHRRCHQSKLKYQKNRKSTKSKQSPVAAVLRGWPEERLETPTGDPSLGSKNGIAPADKVRLYVTFRNGKPGSDKGKREGRRKQSSGELGTGSGCVGEELTAPALTEYGG